MDRKVKVFSLDLIDEILDKLRGIGVDVRVEPLGELKGGYCRIKGKDVLILNSELPVNERITIIVDALKMLKKKLENLYISPFWREMMGEENNL